MPQGRRGLLNWILNWTIHREGEYSHSDTSSYSEKKDTIEVTQYMMRLHDDDTMFMILIGVGEGNGKGFPSKHIWR